MRFIDLAAHGGCSKKASANDVRKLLGRVPGLESSIAEDLPDWGKFENGGQWMSTVDIVLPMVLSPTDFGKITVNHVLSDLYAGGGMPKFALCVLGLPKAADKTEHDWVMDAAVESMSAAVGQLKVEDALLVGGHTMGDQEDFYLGFTAIGKPMEGGPFVQKKCAPGDILILTKPLGTSIATLRWKFENASKDEHADVLRGMMISNQSTAKILAGHVVHACTDVTGYGFLGHLYNILHASGVGGRIRLGALPVYESVKSLTHCNASRQLENNREYLEGHLLERSLDEIQEAILFDSQVSGGLLVSAAPEEATRIIEACTQAGIDARAVGEVTAAPSGFIELTD